MQDEFRRVYGSRIEKYVSDNIISSLLVGYGEGVYNRNELERRNLTLCNKLLSNPELKEEIINKLVDHGIKYSRAYFKPGFMSKNADKIVMDKVHQVLSLNQIVEYAVKFDKEIEANKTQIR